MPELVSLLPLVGIALLFWFILIRPASKRQKDLARMQASLTPGDEVMLTSGVFGVLREVSGDRLRVEIADGVTIEVARGAIGATTPTSSAPAATVVDEPEES